MSLLESPKRFFNRELSWIEFNSRVLEEAQSVKNPPLERLKFLAIFGSNLDEFFMTRVAGIKQQIVAGVTEKTFDGMTPEAEYIAIYEKLNPLLIEAHRLLVDELLPLLREKGIYLLEVDELNKKQKKQAQQIFEKEVFPVLTPLAFDPGRPFPHISHLSLNLALRVHHPGAGHHAGDGERFARLKVPATLPRLIQLDAPNEETSNKPFYFVWLEQIITAHIGSLFPGVDVLETHLFRLTRNADIEIQEDEASDLLHTMKEGLRQRQFGPVVRLTIDRTMPETIKDLLVRNLEIDPKDVFRVERPLGLKDLMIVCDVDRSDLKYPPFIPLIPTSLRNIVDDSDIFTIIRQQDILLHHPYQSFIPVVDLLKVAARDPNVLAIKQTLYRTGRDSPIVRALMEARENEKEVAVLVELKARFDEESNIGWARALEEVGVHVVYGLVGLKTHSKVTLIVRREGDILRRYLHLGTGNYNASTVKMYTDLGLLTCNEDFGADASDLFNYLTGYAYQSQYRKFLIAPLTLRHRFLSLIEREIEQHQLHQNGHLIFKMNALVDPDMIDALYRASQAGVKIDLIVRGVCCLRPQIDGLSETIRVTSIVGRFLEHTRIFYFHNGGQEEIYIGSADLMPRNLNWRVETVFPIEDPKILTMIRDDILNIYLQDTAQARELLSDGTYKRSKPTKGEDPYDSQAAYLRTLSGYSG